MKIYYLDILYFNALNGHVETHSPHRRQPGDFPTSFNTFRFIGHLYVHAIHLVHLFLSSFMVRNDSLFINPYIIPTGQRYLHQNLSIDKVNNITSVNVARCIKKYIETGVSGFKI